MKIIIVGAGGTGLPLAIFLKKDHPEFDIELIEKEDKIGRKLLATGNGKCNLLNMNPKPEDYNNPAYMKKVFEEYPFGELQFRLAELGIVLTNDGDLVYPLSLSAASHVELLGKIAIDSGVKISLGEKVENYSSNEIITNKGKKHFDKLIFATGGKSKPNLGSDGNLFNIFKSHGYEIEELKPGLTPIKTKQKTKEISGIRHKAKVTLMASGIQIHEEEGEVLFKDDGLSGIVIFNSSSYINRLGNPDVTISLDLFPKVTSMTLVNDFLDSMKKNPNYYLDTYFPKQLAKYIQDRAGLVDTKTLGKKEAFTLAKTVKNLEFHLASTYGFDDSQVTIGGIKLEEVGDDLQSKKEKGIYFAGEMLNIDGLCGGFNLTWCLISALLISDSFRK